ncbi:MAG TPA: Asp-tRNA(Asn)/Glu-tRNA(Gln) amidotransferase subunit GatC [Candidatus Saccharimonadales bacterium]|nr:Asp-tRNA(Asn)/Glu-tRNA(Gln) amidotransferase subunit GatC [Candidatus Saccharimonadales bacterium]
MADITEDEVRKLARLARITLTDDQVSAFMNEISAILGYVERLESLDLEDTEPTYQVTGMTNVMRDDVEVDYGTDQSALMKNVPTKEEGSIKVKRVL